MDCNVGYDGSLNGIGESNGIYGLCHRKMVFLGGTAMVLANVT